MGAYSCTDDALRVGCREDLLAGRRRTRGAPGLGSSRTHRRRRQRARLLSSLLAERAAGRECDDRLEEGQRAGSVSGDGSEDGEEDDMPQWFRDLYTFVQKRGDGSRDGVGLARAFLDEIAPEQRGIILMQITPEEVAQLAMEFALTLDDHG